MPIRITHEVPRLTQDEFAQIAYRVMGALFEIHADLGRLFDEKIYRTELVRRLAVPTKKSNWKCRLVLSLRATSSTYSSPARSSS